MPQAMQDPICFETLLATVLLWISLFGMSECALRNVDAILAEGEFVRGESKYR